METINGNQSSVIGGTLKATAAGGIITGGTLYGGAKLIMSKPDTFVKFFEKELTQATAKGDKNRMNLCKEAINRIKFGNIDLKKLGKIAGIAGLVTGGIYLAYRGIKAMFSKD